MLSPPPPRTLKGYTMKISTQNLNYNSTDTKLLNTTATAHHRNLTCLSRSNVFCHGGTQHNCIQWRQPQKWGRTQKWRRPLRNEDNFNNEDKTQHGHVWRKENIFRQRGLNQMKTT